MYQVQMKQELAAFYEVTVDKLDLPYQLWAYIRDGHEEMFGVMPECLNDVPKELP